MERCSPGVCGTGRGWGWNVVCLVFVGLGGGGGGTLFAWCLWDWEGWGGVERCSPGVCGTGRGGVGVERCSPAVCGTGWGWNVVCLVFVGLGGGGGGTLFAWCLWDWEGWGGVERCSPGVCGTGRGGVERCSPGVCETGRGWGGTLFAWCLWDWEGVGWNVVRLVFVELGVVGWNVVRLVFVELGGVGWNVVRLVFVELGGVGWNVVRLVFVELGGGGVKRPVNQDVLFLFFTPSQVGRFLVCVFPRCEPGRLKNNNKKQPFYTPCQPGCFLRPVEQDVIYIFYAQSPRTVVFLRPVIQDGYIRERALPA